MSANTKTTSKEKTKPGRSTSPQGRENQLTALAMDLAEKQLRAGTASAQVISHFLKQSTEEKKLERENMVLKNELLSAQTEQIASQQKVEQLYEEALLAMKEYSGKS